MKVHSIANHNVNTKGLKICYDAEHKLWTSAPSLVTALFKTGRLHEGNQYIDILVMKNLSYRIKEKGNPFFRIKEPIHLKKLSDNKLDISATYDGVPNELYSKGDKYNMSVELDTSAAVDEAIDMFKDMRGLQRISFIAKLIDDYFIKTKSEAFPTGGDRESVVTLLMDKYGDIVI